MCCKENLFFERICFMRQTDWNGKPYHSLDYELKKIFGKKVYKLALDGGMTCPNRDGTLGRGGCIFCSAGGSGDFAASAGSITDQIAQAKMRILAKTSCNKFIAYFQAFTNTYAPVSKLRQLFYEAIQQPEIVALSIATRCDCLSPEILDLLEELNQIKPVWVELGLQTIHPATAEYIRRGYPLSVYDAAVGRLKKRGLEVIVHVILGLPGETTDMMKETVSYVGVSGADGIKLQLLHILKGTDLEKEYEAGRCPVFSMEEYVGLVADCISLLPKDMVIHRMTGDGDKKTLLAPLWSADKKRVWNALQREIASR